MLQLVYAILAQAIANVTPDQVPWAGILNFGGLGVVCACALYSLPKILKYLTDARAADELARGALAKTFQDSLEALNEAQNVRVTAIRSELAATNARMFEVIGNNTAAFNRLAAHHPAVVNRGDQPPRGTHQR